VKPWRGLHRHGRNPPPIHHLFQGLTLKQHIEHTLGTGSIEDAVRLPAGEDLNEWLAVNVVFFYNALNVLYSVLDEDLCTPQRCPVMSAGPQVRARRLPLPPLQH
jgi:hypothetical protein